MSVHFNSFEEEYSACSSSSIPMNGELFIARRRDIDQTEQPVSCHLKEASVICGKLAEKIDASEAGRLLGKLHDLGKYSKAFQEYIRKKNAHSLRGTVDHSTAGAQWVWQQCRKYGPEAKLVGQILAVCLASHHGGLLDCLKPDGKNGFLERIGKDDSETHLEEVCRIADREILEELEQFDAKAFLQDFWSVLCRTSSFDKQESSMVKSFRIGLFTRFLFSCLIDADRISSAEFEHPERARHRPTTPVDWPKAIERMESQIACFPVRNKIDRIRCEISDQCRRRAEEEQGIYTLTVPTGGGKTFSSLRFALHHANRHHLDHVIYVIPFTSIIEQNAAAMRKMLEQDGDEWPWILEHHSNIEPEERSRHSEFVSENWDAPVVLTTMVQLLQALFAGGTRSVRRMHSLAKSVLIFDEIQSLPVNCVHLFCNAVHFLVDQAGATVVLCTATQPLLNDLRYPDQGQLSIPKGHELVASMSAVFDQLKRVAIRNLVRPSGWSENEIVELALAQLAEKGNCLVIANTKKWARKLYEHCAAQTIDKEVVHHLSTSLCPAHRKKILAKVCDRLDDNLPVLCISTQLIEAGVDVDFNVAIRFLAGLDSIAQAAGRCNRNGNMPVPGEVFVLNPQEESIDRLEDIKIGREAAQRIFSEEDKANLFSPEVMRRYFSYYFHDRANVMSYPLPKRASNGYDTLLSLLGENCRNIGRTDPLQMRQSFKTAGEIFEAIDAPTQAVLVPYDKGKEIIALLCADFNPSGAWNLLRQAQQYSVNVFSSFLRELWKAGAIHAVQEGEEIYYVDERHYNEHFGLSEEASSRMDTLTC